MRKSTSENRNWLLSLHLIFGLGMIVSSFMTIRHFFLANYPTSIFEGSFCDINTFFNCDSSAYSVISTIGGVPLGYFGLMVGALVVLGALFPSLKLERTNRSIALVNVVGVIALFLFSVLYLKSLCLLCTGYYISSILSLFLFWRYQITEDELEGLSLFLRPSFKHLVTFGVVVLVGAYGFELFHDAKKEAQSGGVAANVVKEYFSLPEVKSPSFLSPFWTAKSTEKFEDAPIQVIEYADFLCSDCVFLHKQLVQLKEDFAGKINIAFQFFPLEALCNDVVEKDKHPGSCEISYMSAYNPDRFTEMHDEIFANFESAKKPEWRRELAKRYNVEEAVNDSATQALIHQIISTGREYEKTSDKYSHGIRSTPTMIVNNRMIIGTLPYVQLKAIFQALVDEQKEEKEKKFIENWEPTSP